MTGYTHEQLVEATERALQGERQTDLSRIYNVPYRTLKLYIKKMRDTGSIVPKRRGPPPVLPTQCEERLQTWIKDMQTNGYPIKRHDILVKVAEICNVLGIPELGEVWYKCFLERHPLITQRQAQVISRVRNEVDVNGIRTLFYTMAKLIIEERLDGHRLYNMDKTGFASRKKSTKVLALKGSDNMWAKMIAPSFHLTIVAAASAAGDVVPPLLIFPGRQLDRDVSAARDIPNSAITTSDCGFINGFLFEKWLTMFDRSIPVSVKRPVVLVFNGYKSHFSAPAVMARALALRILLVCLPANGTHLVQPLDVAVFGPFKKVLWQDIFNFMVTISKKNAVELASAAWKKSPIGTNAVSGFSACGLYPP
ncbi:hypothetical protein DYB30_010383 [Aphanomyces astaci]|uniref:HTH CENPB-type domain-containing protein n=1 Tax=Aphanomyces astaci TaxID=112090 RepID=A0A397CMA4_APHAT|nr:hypothetical protein DYB30_010383 [Aphanomyces astaci]